MHGALLRFGMAPPNDITFPFLRLPAELREDIYQLLLAPEKDEIIRIRTESPALHKARNAISGRRRSRFRVISDRVRSGSSETSYTGHQTSNIHTAILGVCRQIHREACHVLYSEHTFDFDIDVESIVPFFRDLTPAALASVESIRFVKRALPYCKDFDRCEWRSACAFLATQMKLRRVNLTVVGGRPGPVWGAPVGEWESQGPWKFEDFNHVMQSERMEWARQVTSIRGLRALVVVSALEHCPPPHIEPCKSLATPITPTLELVSVGLKRVILFFVVLFAPVKLQLWTNNRSKKLARKLDISGPSRR
ncbi:MAG: hypothetical protein Q9224_000197 [Gallowayella concinna]